MASESGEEQTVSVDLPAELVAWLDEEASAADVDRETALTQLLASYQTMKQMNGEFDQEQPVFETGHIASSVEDEVTERIQDEVRDAIASQGGTEELKEELEKEITSLESDLSSEIGTLRTDLERQIEAVETEFDGKIQDVRKRVVQVKKETDRKAPADHSHEEISTIRAELEALSTELEEAQEEFHAELSGHEETTAEHAETLENVQERLQTLAWVVRDLREDRQKSSFDAVDRIKHAAARADIERANCERCGEGISIALMTEARCPHCETTLSNVEPASGWFGDPTLTVPSQLESGEDR